MNICSIFQNQGIQKGYQTFKSDYTLMYLLTVHLKPVGRPDLKLTCILI